MSDDKVDFNYFSGLSDSQVVPADLSMTDKVSPTDLPKFGSWFMKVQAVAQTIDTTNCDNYPDAFSPLFALEDEAVALCKPYSAANPIVETARLIIFEIDKGRTGPEADATHISLLCDLGVQQVRDAMMSAGQVPNFGADASSIPEDYIKRVMGMNPGSTRQDAINAIMGKSGTAPNSQATSLPTIPNVTELPNSQPGTMSNSSWLIPGAALLLIGAHLMSRRNQG